LTVTRHVQNVHHWQEHKHASMLAISYQSSTTPSLSTHMQQMLPQLINVMKVTVTSYLRHKQ